MSKRKTVPSDVQKQVLLKSRRRCCLCFWLDQVDETVKGQIAHLDQDASNSSFDNLAFLCLEHHDEYDGKPNVSKGFQQAEVTQWRDELYKEMEYRFRSVRTRKVEVSIAKFDYVNRGEDFSIKFLIKNAGDTTIKNLVFSVRLPSRVTAKSPRKKRGTVFQAEVIDVEMHGFHEEKNDLFGCIDRVGIYQMYPLNSGILPGHTYDIVGLGFRCVDYPESTELKLDYRVDAEDMEPQRGTLTKTIPCGVQWFVQ